MRQINLHMRRASSFITCRDQNRNRRNINHKAGYIYFAFAIIDIILQKSSISWDNW